MKEGETVTFFYDAKDGVGYHKERRAEAGGTQEVRRRRDAQGPRDGGEEAGGEERRRQGKADKPKTK